MDLYTYDIIARKRDGETHTCEEIEYFIHGYTKGEIQDYQVSAWLMACFLNNLNEDETYYLTKAMVSSGKVKDLTSIQKPKIDKHSTGGVGDKISLILAPAVAACGVAVPMTSGRGLGFTGGTLDKLESIPGFNVNLTEQEFLSVLKKVGFAMSGQTESLAPVDKKLYALRDVTGTVESIPLITSSILSKKLAEGADAIVMDVKCGSGAFMKTIEESRKLADSLVRTAGRMGKRVVCVLSNMDQPLGRAVGNSLEVIESIECLRGKGQRDIVELVSLLGGIMLVVAGLADSADRGKQTIEEKLKNGEAFERFKELVRFQGGDVDSVIHVENLPHTKFALDIRAKATGFVTSINTESVGKAAVLLGAGRLQKEDRIDPAAGIIVRKKIGDRVLFEERIATLYYNDERNIARAAELMAESYAVEDEPPAGFQLIHEVIG